ncbi:PCI-domain-containing protein [Hypomontagnella monticulosa]|nr:PCI-domain-containing protein [Hypomontagnella monticulosa]
MATQRAPPATERASQGATRQEMQYVFVEGTFADHAQDMANHLNLELDVKPLIEKGQKDEVLKKLILASTALNSEPEKEFCSHYNLLIYLVLESDKAGMLLPRVCDNLTKPITSSPVNGPGLALGALTTIFNLLQKRTEQNNELRFNVFVTIVRFVKLHGMYADIRKCLPSIKGWLTLWETDEDDQRKLFLDIAELAHDAGDDETSYQHVLNALRTFDEDEVKSEEAQQLALRALKIALLSSTHYDFQDVIAVPAIQNLSDSHPVYFELLTIFAEKDLEDYNDFNDEHEGFIEKEHLDGDKLLRKIRLLTFTSLAASTPSREIPYEEIAKALQIGPKEVELWTIDVIRAGLVEGKLSQQKQVFLVHKTLYRVFGEKQWREVGLRLKSWSTAINNLLTVLRNGQSDVEAARRRETEEIERRLANAGMNEGSGGGRRGGGDRPPRRERTDDDD